MLSDLMKFCKQYFIVSRYSGFVIRAESLECGCLPDFFGCPYIYLRSGRLRAKPDSGK